jgi:hypothetical protein
MLPDELSETLKRTEALAVQSALALCLAYELMERCRRSGASAEEQGLRELRDRVHRVGEALGTVLEHAHAKDFDEEPGFARPSSVDGRRLN